MKTFWLSFANPDLPRGEQFQGVCVVDVDEDDVESALAHNPLPATALPGAEWVAAAAWKAWQMACNPGGEIAMTEITDPTNRVPRNRLLGKAELREIL